MTIDEIKELIRIVNETEIAELEVQRGENRVRIKRTVGTNQEVIMPTMVSMPVTAGGPAAGQKAGHAAGESLIDSAGLREENRDVLVKSPIVGTYYDAPAPGEGPFVRIGDRVEPKQVLCIIESMMLMNEIEAETAGILVAKLVENGRPVEYGESLFTIRPH